ncbi:hypothetical protein HOY82DRAFT_604562 [Tuber indicum]|nr:hypothetical protein HOY82DRAFT_604562 [Tuber indicum]
MVSDFLTVGGCLHVPSTILNDEFEYLDLPRRFVTEYLKYGKDNYWICEKMVNHTIKIALPIFSSAFPRFTVVWAFDNASNHCCFHENALLLDWLNKGPGGMQPVLLEGFFHANGRS